MYRQSRNYENLNRAIFEGSGPYEIPTLRKDNTRADIFVGFNYAKSCKDPGTKGLHFFVDDYQFMRLWTNPDAYIPMLQKFKAVCTPRLLTVHRLSACNSDLQPLPQALARSLYAVTRYQSYTDNCLV